MRKMKNEERRMKNFGGSSLIKKFLIPHLQEIFHSSFIIFH